MRNLCLCRNGFRILGATLQLLVLWSPVPVVAEIPVADPIEEVVVVGKRPGPPLWKVVHGDHVLFIFGALDPPPKSLKWDSESVDWIISQSDEFIGAPSIAASTSNPFRAIRILREIRKLERLPTGQTLRDVLPADVYQTFLDARSRYAPKDRRIMTLRPMFAARELASRAFDSVGLGRDSPIPKYLRKTARKNGLTITDTQVELSVDEALTLLRDMWFAAAQRALEHNVSTISILPLGEIFAPDVLLARLRQHGYVVSGAAVAN